MIENKNCKQIIMDRGKIYVDDNQEINIELII